MRILHVMSLRVNGTIVQKKDGLSRLFKIDFEVKVYFKIFLEAFQFSPVMSMRYIPLEKSETSSLNI